MDKRLNRGLVQMAQIGSALPGFLSHDKGLWVNQTEGVDDDLALDRLDWIDDHGNSTRGQLLKTLLGIDIDRREPAPETGMRMVPADNRLGPVWGWTVSLGPPLASAPVIVPTFLFAEACPSSWSGTPGRRPPH